MCESRRVKPGHDGTGSSLQRVSLAAGWDDTGRLWPAGVTGDTSQQVFLVQPRES